MATEKQRIRQRTSKYREIARKYRKKNPITHINKVPIKEYQKKWGNKRQEE